MTELQGRLLASRRNHWRCVRDAYQNKGIASTMLCHLAFIARKAGISDLHAHILPGNRRALRVLDNLGFPRTVSPKRNMMRVTLHLARLVDGVIGVSLSTA